KNSWSAESRTNSPLGCGGKDYFKCGTDADLTIKTNLSAMKLHRPECLGHPDSGSAFFFRVVKIEYAFLGFVRDAHPSVSYCDSGRTVVAAGRRYFERSSLGHSLAAVNDYVKQRLFEKIGIALYHKRSGLELFVDAHTALLRFGGS